MANSRSESIPRLVYCSIDHKIKSHALYTDKLTFAPCFPPHTSKTTNIPPFRSTTPWDLWRRRFPPNLQDLSEEDSFHSSNGDCIGGQDYPADHHCEGYHHTNESESEPELEPHQYTRTKSSSNRQHPASVSDLSDSQSSRSRSTAGSHRSSSSGSQSSTQERAHSRGQPSSKRKSKGPTSSQNPPPLPGKALAASIYANKDLRRLAHLQHQGHNNMSRKETNQLVAAMNDGEKVAYYKQMMEDKEAELNAANKQLQQSKKPSKTGRGSGSAARRVPNLQDAVPPLQAGTGEEDVSAHDHDGTAEIILVDLGDVEGGSSDHNAVCQALKKHVWRIKKWTNRTTERGFAELVLDSLNKKGFQLTNNPALDVRTYCHTFWNVGCQLVTSPCEPHSPALLFSHRYPATS